MAGPTRCTRSARSRFWISSSVFIYLIYLTQCLSTSVKASNIDAATNQFHSVDVTRPTISGGLPRRAVPGGNARLRRDANLASRELPDTADNLATELLVNYVAFGQNFTLQLHPNEILLPDGYFEKYHKNGKFVVEKPLQNKNSRHCYYQGEVLNRSNSWAAVSLCNGVSGMIFDGEDVHYIEPKSSSLDHLVFKDPKDIPFKCGYNSSETHSHMDFLSKLSHERVRRSTDFVRDPYKSNSDSRYIELVIVNDHQEFKERNSSKEDVFERSKQIANIVNGLYAPLNIYIALVGVVIWSEYDEIKLSPDGDATLTNFLHYRRQKLAKEHPNDNAQLITAMKFDGGVVGKALKGPICTWEFSGGVNMDHSKIVGLVATTVAHEIGHNFGMEHDSDECHCPDDKCIMSPSSGSTSPRHWSTCSKNHLKDAYVQSMEYCLRNKPNKIIGPVCGNGFLERGEECDCGYKEFCDNKCCNATTCKLSANAVCATGACCDTNTCQLKEPAFRCRKEYSECDLPEYCNGESEFCPSDVYVHDGAECRGGKAYCYEGHCKTHNDQCKLLWGPSGEMSELKCFDQNQQGNDNGNCGYFKPNKTHKSCNREDILCGRLHCVHLNEKLEFGLESAATLAHSYIQHRGKTVICKSATVDLGIDSLDPGLTPNGAKCGKNKACLNQKCQPIEKLKTIHYANCNSNGICNNKGNCHCSVGFGPPFCDGPGPGGSVDSGPMSDPNAGYQFLVAMYIIFLCIVPLTAIAGFGIYHFRKHLKTWWVSKARKAAINRSRAKQASMRKPRPPSCVGTDLRNVEISRPLPPDSDSAVNASTLARSNSGKGTWGRSSLRNIEISPPIPQSTTNSSVGKLVPVRPAPPKPLVTPQRTPTWTPGSMALTNPFATVTRSSSVRTNGENGRPLSGVARPQCPPPPRPPPPKVPPPPLPLNNSLEAVKNENNVKERSVTPNSLIYSDPSEPLDFSNTPLAFVHSNANSANFQSNNLKNNANLNNSSPTYGNVGWNDFTSGFENLQKKPYLNNSVNLDKNLSSKVLKKPVYANGDQAINVAPAPPPASAKPSLVLAKPRSVNSNNGTAMSTFSSNNPVSKKNSFEQPNLSASNGSAGSHASVVASLAQKFEKKTGENGDNTTGRVLPTRPYQMRNNSSHT